MEQVPASAARRPDSRRDLILDAAARLFAERGYADTGIDDIGDGAGVTGPAIYRHFKGKQAILDELLVEHMRRIVDAADRMAHDGAPADVILERLVAARVEFNVGPLGHVVTLFQRDEKYCSPAAREDLSVLRRSYEEVWLDVLRKLRPDLPSADLRFTVHAALVMIGYGSVKVLRDEEVAASEVEPGALRQHLTRMALAAVRA